MNPFGAPSYEGSNQWNSENMAYHGKKYSLVKLKRYRCTLMLLNNLAEPEWVSVDCNSKLISDVFCVKDTRNWYAPSYQIQSSMCSKSDILIHKACYSFTWISNDRSKWRPCSKTKALLDMKIFQFIFDAVSVTFPPLISPDLSQRVTYKRFRGIYKYFYESDKGIISDGIQICPTKKVLIPERYNLFRCKSGAYISYEYICDDIPDCPEEIASDELNCFCKSAAISKQMNSRCKYIKRTFLTQNESTAVCSMFYFKSTRGDCVIHKWSDVKQVKYNFSAVFMCNNGTKISNTLVNDLVADCGLEMEDEFHLKQMIDYGSAYTCQNPEQLPCKIGHSKCYNISEICSYKLNEYDNLIPCRTGGHIEKCKDFQCNIMFKCPEYYCIPWSYVCDGKWDCPLGTDELTSKICSTLRSCIGMFKCKHVHVCIHPASICDQKNDCPWKDDETHCEISSIECPYTCACVLFSMVCFTTSASYFTEFKYPFHFAYLKRYSGDDSFKLFQQFPQVRIFRAVNGKLRDICFLISISRIIVEMDFSFNSITKLESKCICNFHTLQNLQLHNNGIFQISNQAFCNLTNLNILNLAHNFLKGFSYKYILYPKSTMLLNLRNNSFKKLEIHSFEMLQIQLIQSDNYKLCCILPEKVMCVSKVAQFASCTTLMKTDITMSTAFIMALSIILTNISVIFLEYSSTFKRNIQRFRASEVIFCTIGLMDVTYGVYLVILLVAHITYGDLYVLREEQWRASLSCHIAFTLSLYYNIASPLMQLFLSLSRYRVIRYSLSTQLKKFVLRCVLGINALVVTLAISTTTAVTMKIVVLPFKLCSPLIDPTQSSKIFRILIILIVFLQIFTLIMSLILSTQLINFLIEQKQETQIRKIRNQSKASPFSQIIIVDIFHVVCILPSNIVYLYFTFASHYIIDLVIWVIVLVAPIKCFVHPLVFSIHLFQHKAEN